MYRKIQKVHRIQRVQQIRSCVLLNLGGKTQKARGNCQARAHDFNLMAGILHNKIHIIMCGEIQ